MLNKILQQGYLILFLAFLLTSLAASTSYASINITEDAKEFRIVSGKYNWLISKEQFSVIKNASIDENIIINGGQVNVDFLGSTTTFAPPSEFLNGNDWIEVRGWADQPKNLWYIARYQFHDNNPLLGLSLTITDRHDKTKTEGQWDPSWKERKISNLHIKLNSALTVPNNNYIQYNSHSGSSISDPFVEVVSRSGSPYQWLKSTRSIFNGAYQLEHNNIGAGENQIIWHLKHNGEANLEASFIPFSGGSAYLAAKNISYVIKHANGIDNVKIDSQEKPPIQLGKYVLDENSTVTLMDDGNSGILLADSITVKPINNTNEKIIRVGERLADNVLHASPMTLLVQNLWQNHPIEVYSKSQNIGVITIKEPTIFMGGMGKTFDIGISIEGNPDNALTLFNSPPLTAPNLDNWNNIDGLTTHSTEFFNLLNKIGEIVDTQDNNKDNFGWKNWGDFQIGTSFINSNAEPMEDWGSLQIDLPTGLLLTWLNTKNANVWLRAKAAVRHSMDIDIVKFMPFRDKFAGAAHRKGACPLAESHICTEPVFDYNFGWRGLLLYHLITGEIWAKDVAQMQIDNSAYIAKTRKTYLLKGGRPAAWVLRALIYGTKYFPEGTRYLNENTETPMPTGSSYETILTDVMTDLIALTIEQKKFPGFQPVWSGQGIETIAQYHQLTGNTDAKNAVILAVDHLIASARINNSKLEFMYDENIQQWVNASNYGWLWLSPIAYAFELTKDQKYKDFGDLVYEHSVKNMENETTIRPWTSVIGYPWLYIKTMIPNDVAPPQPPTNVLVR